MADTTIANSTAFLTIPSRLQLQSSDLDYYAKAETDTTTNDNKASAVIPIYFEEDWQTGIGGGLWSTGLAFCQYWTTSHAASQLHRLHQVHGRGLDVLEVGSGNGLLSTCFLALVQQLDPNLLDTLVVTDLATHLPLIQTTFDANFHLNQSHVHVLEHAFGNFATPIASENSSLEDQVKCGTKQFDLILGSDVAYHADLYDILIKSFEKFAHDSTVILVGATMMDTKPHFFHKLREAGFHYEKFADNLLPNNFRGRTFGIFKIQKTKTYHFIKIQKTKNDRLSND